MDGITPIYEFKELLGIRELPSEDEGGYTTRGGFVVTQLGHIPSAGEQFEAGGRRYEVLDMDGNRVDKVLVTEVPQAGPGEEAVTTAATWRMRSTTAPTPLCSRPRPQWASIPSRLSL